MEKMIKNKQGLALVAAIMLIVFVSVAVLGLSVFIVQWYKQIDIQERENRSMYNAMAGINYAIYQYRASGALTNGTIAINADNNFTLSTVSSGGGGEAANLVINATASSLSGSSKTVLGITLTNTSLSSAITLDRIVLRVSDLSENLDKVTINSVDVRNSTDSITTTSSNLDLTTNAAIPANTTRALNAITFVNAFNPVNLFMGFIMLDASATSICTVYPAQGSTCTTTGASNLTIKSMGKTTGSNQYRSVQVTYNTATGNISDYDEIFQTVP